MVRGRVADAETRAPLGATALALIDAQQNVVARAVATGEGVFGTFLDRADIERRRPSRTVDLLTGIAGVRIQYNRDGSRSVMTRSVGFRGACRPRILLDGIEVRWFNLDHDLSPHDVEAVEIYRGSVQTPARFGGTNSSCGVLVFWTRR